MFAGWGVCVCALTDTQMRAGEAFEPQAGVVLQHHSALGRHPDVDYSHVHAAQGNEANTHTLLFPHRGLWNNTHKDSVKVLQSQTEVNTQHITLLYSLASIYSGI